MQSLVTGFSGGIGSVRLMVGLDDLDSRLNPPTMSTACSHQDTQMLCVEVQHPCYILMHSDWQLMPMSSTLPPLKHHLINQIKQIQYDRLCLVSQFLYQPEITTCSAVASS